MSNDLHALKMLLTPRKAWLQGEYSDDPTHPTCFCLNGAVAFLGGFTPHVDKLDAHPVIKAHPVNSFVSR